VSCETSTFSSLAEIQLIPNHTSQNNYCIFGG